MSINTEERVEAMLPDADQETIDRAVEALDAWVRENAAAVRSMGPATRTMAHMAVSAVGTDLSVGCPFNSWRCDLYSVTVRSGAELSLAEGEHRAPHAADAISVIGALLDKLGMWTSLR